MDNLYNKLQAIQSQVYHHFTYETDLEQYHVEEKWVMPNPSINFKGDCEDFALACRKLCREQNIPSRLVVCEVEGEGHCVLEVNGWIFDCNYDKVVARDDLTSYNWLYVSGYNSGDSWTNIVA